MKWLNLLGKYMDRQPAGGVKNPGYRHVGGEVMVHRDFDEVVRRAPRSALAEALAIAIRSKQTPSFGESVARLFARANPQQRAAMLNMVLTVVPDSVRGDLAGMFSRNREVRPEDTNGLTPDLVRQVSEVAVRKDQSIVDRMAEYLSEYPSLVKNLDIATLAFTMATVGENLAGGGRTMAGGGGA
ncbi:MAG: hypothetical protein ACM3ZB_09580 [bacterium]|jgi:hypothetical protein